MFEMNDGSKSNVGSLHNMYYVHVNTLLFESMVAPWLVCLTLHVDFGVQG